MRIGAQLYTVRDYCKTLTDFSDALKRTADIGYEIVQVSGTCAFEPQWLDEQLKAAGLACVLTHTPAPRLTENPAQVAADHDAFGCKYVGLGWYGFDPEKPDGALDAFEKLYKPVAQALKEHGKYFMYHNHAHEFRLENGRLVLEQLAERFSPDEMGFTLDTYWIQVGGGDPAQWVEKLSGRVPCIHLKDYAYGQKMAVIGEGNINFDRVFEKAESAGTEYMLVEQDDCNGENPFDCLKRSREYLNACGFR